MANPFDEINELCDEFRRQWKNPENPRLESYLDRVAQDAQVVLLRNLLPIDIEYRRRRQERPSSDEYIQRLPAHARLIRQAFFESTQRSLRADEDTGDCDVEVLATASIKIPAASRLGDYELVRELGRGAFGIVFEARHVQRRHRVALKTLPLGQSGFGDAKALQDFKSEFRTLVDVNHPHLVGLHTLEVDGTQWFFTMDLIEGENFLSYVRPAGELDEARLRGALSQLASGVMALHGQGIIHRDLKPSNVLVANDGRVVILDFGLVVDLQRRGDATQSQGFAGTPPYAAPEQAWGACTDACDWYAVGSMLYEALTGRLPYPPDPNLLRLLELKLQQDAPPIEEHVPEDLKQLAMLLLVRDLQQRGNALDIAKVLQSEQPLPENHADSRGQLIGREPQLAVAPAGPRRRGIPRGGRHGADQRRFGRGQNVAGRTFSRAAPAAPACHRTQRTVLPSGIRAVQGARQSD